MDMTEAEARREILEKVREYYHCFHDGKRWDGKHVSYGGRVYDEREMENLTEAMHGFWFNGRDGLPWHCAEFWPHT